MSTQDDAMRALLGMVVESDRTTMARNLNYGERSRGGVDAMSTSEQPLDRTGIRNYMMNSDFDTNGVELSQEEMQRAMQEARAAGAGLGYNEYGAQGAGNLNFIQEPVYDMNQPQYQNPGQIPGQQIPVGGYAPPTQPYGYPPQYPTQPYHQQPYQPQYPNGAAPAIPQVPIPATPLVAQQQATPRPTPKNAAEVVYQLYDIVPQALQRIEDNQMLILRQLKNLQDTVGYLQGPNSGGDSPNGEFFPDEDPDSVSAEDVVSQILPDAKAKKMVDDK